MENESLNLKRKKENKLKLSKIKRRIFRHVWLTRIAILLFFLAILFLVFYLIVIFTKSRGLGDNVTLVKNFILAPHSEVDSSEGRINVLVLGKGGSDHDAPDLTDTMMLVSIPLDKETIKLISIPRDLWIKEIRAKVNSSYYWGNQKQEGGGLVLAKSVVEGVLGERIQYGVVIDFDSFILLIDALGGVEINVENSFVDEKYPIAGMENADCGEVGDYGCRYETVSFEKGVNVMSGELALKYVRSRNSEGDEGTDLARAARQEHVVKSVARKVLSRELFFSPSKRKEVLSIFHQSIETDIPFNTQAVVARKIFDSRSSVSSAVIPEELLEVPAKSADNDYLYVFAPKGGTFSLIHAWVAEFLGN